MDYIINGSQKLFRSSQRSDILMDEEEQQNFFDKQHHKEKLKINKEKDLHQQKHDRKLQERKQSNYFDRDGLSLKEMREYLHRQYKENKKGFEKCFIVVVILALALVMVGISVVLMSTFDSQNIQRKTQLLNDDVIKPVNDMRNIYKLITLPNQLQVLIIGNNSTQYTSVSLDVHAGSWQEPQQIPGLAHFLEHMSFYQSEKYNISKYFDTFLSVNGGYTNSFTSQDHTNYLFTVKSQELDKSLDIFAHMFIDPIYDLGLAKKESSVVESEFRISLQDDDQKIRYLLSQLSDPSHPYTRFIAGNVQSLRDNLDINIIEELEKFRKTYYSSNLMKLVIFTDEDIQNVEDYIQVFQDIPNTFADKPNFSEFQKPIKNTKKMIKLQTLDENEVFYMVYQIDIDRSQYRKRPIEYITYFFNNQMDGGLKYYLKETLDLIIDIEIGNILDQQNYSMFYIKFTMQDQKLLEYSSVVNAVMNYLEFIKNEGLEESVYQQRALIANLTFSYNGQTVMSEENVSNYAWNLNEFDYKEVFAADSTWSETLDKNYIQSVVNQMQSFENIILIAGSSNFSNQKYDDINYEDIEEAQETDNKVNLKNNLNFIQTITPASTFSPASTTSATSSFADIQEQNKELENAIDEIEEQDQDDEYLKNDEFENKEPLYNLYYTEKLLEREQMEKMLKIDENIGSQFKIEQKNPYIPSSVQLEDICRQNKMQIDMDNIDLSGHEIPEVDSKVCLYSPYENPIRKFTNFRFTKFELLQSEQVCKDEEYIDKYQKYPNLIKYENGIEGWYKFDLFYKVPQVVGYFNILFEERYENPRAVLSGKIVSKIYQKRIAQALCDALDAGYHIEVVFQYSSLSIKVVGWSENFNDVALKLFQIWKDLTFNEEEYENAKEEVQSEVDDFKQWNTQEQGEQYFLKKVLIEQYIDPKILLEQLKKIKYQNVVSLNQKDKDNSKLISLIMGNLQAEKAQELLNRIDTTIQFKKDMQEYRNVYGVFDIDSLYFIKVKTVGSQQDLSRSLISFYQIGKRNSITITEGKIFAKMLKQYMYGLFMSEKELICSISTELVSFGSVDGILFSITSEQTQVIDLQQHLYEAIIAFRDKLPLILDSQFEDIKQSQLRELYSSPPTLKDKAEKLWTQLNQFNYVFDEQDILISALLSTYKEDIISSFESIFIKEPKMVSIQVHNSFDQINKKTVIKDNTSFNKKYQVKIITNIFKEMKDRSFNMFAGEVL